MMASQIHTSQRRPSHPGLFSVTLIGLIAAASGCTDLRSYAGTWHGPIVAESAVRLGFAAKTQVSSLILEDVSLTTLRATLSTSDGRFDTVSLTRFLKAASDNLASMTFDNNPLESYLLFGSPQGPRGSDEPPALVVISLFPDEKVQLRVLRGNDLFGVFHLERAP